MAEGLPAGNAQVEKVPGPRADEPPTLPEAHPQATTEPLVELVEQPHLRRQREVARPALNVPADLRDHHVVGVSSTGQFIASPSRLLPSRDV